MMKYVVNKDKQTVMAFLEGTHAHWCSCGLLL